jgi:hypothetical protein
MEKSPEGRKTTPKGMDKGDRGFGGYRLMKGRGGHLPAERRKLKSHMRRSSKRQCLGDISSGGYIVWLGFTVQGLI